MPEKKTFVLNEEKRKENRRTKIFKMQNLKRIHNEQNFKSSIELKGFNMFT